MTSVVGIPDHLHQDTIACSNFEEAKVFVKVDVSKTLPKEVVFTLEGQEFTADFYYPWLPSRCKLCEKWGHTEKVCGLSKRERKIQDNGKKTESQVNVGRAEIVNSSEKSTNKKNVSQGQEMGDIVKTAVKGTANKLVEVTSESGEAKEIVWSLVSPDKVGRAQSKSPQREEVVVQISASKYSILSLNGIEEGEIESREEEEEEKEEVEVSDNLESDLLEDEILDQRNKEKDKSTMKKGGRRVQKTKAHEVQPKSKRSSKSNL